MITLPDRRPDEAVALSSARRDGLRGLCHFGEGPEVSAPGTKLAEVGLAKARDRILGTEAFGP